MEATVTSPIEQEIRERLAPPELPPEPPQPEVETDEQEHDVYLVSLEFTTEGLTDVEAVKKAHELIQSATSKGLRLASVNVSDFFLTPAANDLVERLAERG